MAANPAPPPVTPRVLIAGLGNVLLMDDGVGVHAVRALRHDPPPGALLVEVGTAVVDLPPLLETADLLLALDALQAGGAPGTIYRLEWDPRELAGSRASLHDISLRDVLNWVPPQRRPHTVVLGVEPACIDYGLELSPPVRAALPAYLTAVRAAAAGCDRPG